MEYKKIISEQPYCKTCKNIMKEWNPFASEHEHIECIAERVSDKMLLEIKIQFETIKNNIKEK